MKDELQRIHDKIDDIGKSLNSVDKTLIKQEANIAEHMRRTQLLEEQMRPVRSHVLKMQGAGQLILYASLMATILAAVLMWK